MEIVFYILIITAFIAFVAWLFQSRPAAKHKTGTGAPMSHQQKQLDHQEREKRLINFKDH